MNVRLGYISDCHLEFAKRSFHVPDGLDILILAGDTHRSPGDSRKAMLELREQTELPIVYVCGNHEFYGKTFPNGYKRYKKLLSQVPDLYVLEKDIVIIKGVRILGTTLWSDLSNPIDELCAQLSMNDYNFIQNPEHNTKKITPKDTTTAFKENKDWLISVLEKGFKGPTIVVTHHIPTFQVVDFKFRNDPVTPAYASNLDDILVTFAPDVWIYGHSHSGLSMRIAQTEVITNPIGYPHEGGGNPMKFKEFDLVKEDKK